MGFFSASSAARLSRFFFLFSSSSSKRCYFYRTAPPSASSSHGRHRTPNPHAVARPLEPGGGGERLLYWSSSLLPLAVAASAGALVLDLPPNHSLCDPGPDLRVGRKDSTEVRVQGARKELPQGIIDELRAVCKSNMTLDYEERCFHGKPPNSFHKAVNVPDVVVYPRSQEDVVKIVISCNNYKVPIVPYGGATSLEGQTLAPHGGVCIDMSLMKNVKSLHVEDMDVVVEPGIGWIELNEYLKPYGLFFPLDPGPGATIGGMCATRCSGSLAVSL